MTTKVKALDRLIDAIAGSDVPVSAQTVAGTIDALADTLAGDDVSFTAQDIAGRIDELAAKIESGEITIGGGGGDNWQPIRDGNTHFWVFVPAAYPTVTFNFWVNSSVSAIDWGDGSTPESMPANGRASHTYANPGEYIVTVTVTSGTLKMGDDTTGGCLNSEDASDINEMRITNIELGNNIQMTVGSLYNNYCVRNVVFPDGLTSIPNSNVSHWRAIQNINIPESVTTIGTNFCSEAYGVEELTIPENVTSIGEFFLYYASSMRIVHMKPTTPPTLNTSSFTNTHPIFYVPAESVNAYKAATNWSNVSGQIFAEPSGR